MWECCPEVVNNYIIDNCSPDFKVKYAIYCSIDV